MGIYLFEKGSERPGQNNLLKSVIFLAADMTIWVLILLLKFSLTYLTSATGNMKWLGTEKIRRFSSIPFTMILPAKEMGISGTLKYCQFPLRIQYVSGINGMHGVYTWARSVSIIRDWFLWNMDKPSWTLQPILTPSIRCANFPSYLNVQVIDNVPFNFSLF